MNRGTTASILTLFWLILLFVGAGVLHVFEGENEQAICQKAIELFDDGVTDKAAQETVQAFLLANHKIEFKLIQS